MFPGWWMPLYGRVRPHLTTCLIWPQHCFSMKPTLCLPITRRWCLPSSLMNTRHVKRYRHDRSRCTVNIMPHLHIMSHLHPFLLAMHWNEYTFRHKVAEVLCACFGWLWETHLFPNYAWKRDKHFSDWVISHGCW